MTVKLANMLDDILDVLLPYLPFFLLPVLLSVVFKTLRALILDDYSGSLFMDICSWILSHLKRFASWLWRKILPVLLRIQDHFLVQEVPTDE